MTFVILGTLAGWFTGRTLRTGDLVVVDVVLGVAGALVGGFILSVAFESASSSVLFTLVTATAGRAVPVWLLELTVAPSRPSTSSKTLMATRAYLPHGEQHTDAQGVISSRRKCARVRASSRDTCICECLAVRRFAIVSSPRRIAAPRWSFAVG